MGFLKRDDPNDPQQAPQAAATEPAEAPHTGEYRAGSLEGLPASGRERLERMKQDIQ